MTKARRTKPKSATQVGSAKSKRPPNPEWVRSFMLSLAASVAQGSKKAGEVLQRWIAKYPEIAGTIRRCEDLCATAEAAWLRALVGDDLFRQHAVKKEVAELKAELLGESPSIVDRILVSHIATAHLAHQVALLWAAQPGQPQAGAAARDKRVESAARRLMLALKTLSILRQQAGRGLVPKTKLEVFDGSG